MTGRTLLSSFLESHHLSKWSWFTDKCSLPKAPFRGEVHQGRSSPARSNRLVYDLCLCILETSYKGPKVRFDASIESDSTAPTPAVLHWVQSQIRWQSLFWRDVGGNVLRVNKTIVILSSCTTSRSWSVDKTLLQTLSPHWNACRIRNND